MKVVALVPSYEPDAQLLDVVERLSNRGCDVVVVDDGSGEAYADLFRRAAEQAKLVTYPNNRGKGAALKAGLAHIISHYPADTIVVTVDGDGQHDPSDALRCAAEAASQPDALVLGVRRFDRADVPLRSRLGNTITCAVFQLTSGMRIQDTQTGLRAFSLRIAPRLLHVDGERYEYEMNMLYGCGEQGVPLIEVPIQTIYHDNNRASHFDALRDSARIYRSVLTFAGASLAGFACDYLMFALLMVLFGDLGRTGVILANVGARLVSASVNYTLNRTVVFRSTEPVSTTAPRYAALAATILTVNTLTVTAFTSVAMDPLVAKLVVEGLLFVASWAIQHRVVFVRKERTYA